MPTTADLIAALRRRWRLEVAIVGLVLALVLIWTLLSDKTYVAQASLLFDAAPVAAVADAGQAQPDNVAALVATQADVLLSVNIAAAVAQDLGLTADPNLVSRWSQTTGGVGDINAWYGRQLLSKLEVTPGRSSRVLAIRYSSPDPNFAARVANGFATSYLTVRLRQQTDPARTYSRWFEDRTREVRSALEQAQARLTAFQRQTGIVDTAGNNADTARLSELSGQLTAAEAAAADVGARARGGASTPDVQSSGVIQGLRSQISTKSAEVAQLAADLGPNHPVRQAAEAELAALRQRLGAEAGTSSASVQSASTAARGKESELRSLLNGQRGKMLAQSTDRARLDVLQRDVDSARAAYDTVTQKLGTMRLQSEAPTTNVTQLDVAQPPLLPSSPNVPLRLLLGLVLGVMFAVAAAILIELRRPRVRTLIGAANVTGAPVLGTIMLSNSRVAGLLADRRAA